MNFGGHPFAESSLAGVGIADLVAPPAPGEPEVPLIIDPFTIEIAGVSVKPLINTLSIDDELGRQSSASFTLVNTSSIPLVGQPVKIKWYEDVLFGGSIDRVVSRTNNTGTFQTYDVECVDQSYLLFRRKITREWTNVQWGVLASEAYAEGFSTGTMHPLGVNVFLPLVSVKDGNLHDLLSEAAASLGCTFYVDWQKKMHLIAAALPSAPGTLDDTIVETAEVKFDREAYRNKQTVTVTGTPAVQSEAPLTSTHTRQNDAQIAERAAIEGTNGIYNDLESITHPTSNIASELQRLAVSYAKLRLGVSGSVRHWMTVRTRASGYKAGQLVTVDLPLVGGSGTWVIQRTSMREESGRFAIHTLELNRSTLVRRAQELWLDIVRKGEIVVLPPATGLLVTVTTFSTPGNTNWVVPGGVTEVQCTCRGGSAGGGGGAVLLGSGGSVFRYQTGGKGGNGGQAISVLSVTPGETLTITVGAGGAAGSSTSNSLPTLESVGTAGSAGGSTIVKRGTTELISAIGALGGGGAKSSWLFASYNGYPGGDGVGIGQINTYGGGPAGGAGGTGSPFAHPAAGVAGSVIMEY